MIKAVILDADGVVINGNRFSELLKKDYGLTDEDTASFFKGKFQDCLTRKADLKIEIAKYLKEWRIDKSVDDFLDYWFKSEHKVNEELIAYVREFQNKGIKCYLATNQEKYRTEYLLKNMNFDNIFDGVFSSALIGYKKPQKEFYEYILEKLNNLNKDEIIFWDNSIDNVKIAKKLNLKAKLYTNFNDFKKNTTALYIKLIL